MKIAVFHNLPIGGAYKYFIETSRYLSVKNKLDLFTFKNYRYPKYFNNKYIYKLKKTKNIIGYIFQCLIELKEKSKEIAKIINSNNYDLVIINQCYITQSPYLLKYIENKKKNIYILHEPKREFYETTSYDYFSFKKILSRIIRYPIKLIDISNCSKAKNIVCNSNYSKNIVKKIYNKNAIVIYPGMKIENKLKIIKNNNNNYVTIGLLSKIKGYKELIELFTNTHYKLTIIGRNYYEKNYLKEIINHNKNIRVIVNASNLKINNILKNSTFYICNSENEPFGLSTLEAAEAKCFLIGNNTGGTPEIIKNGINGINWPENIIKRKKILNNFYKQNNINFYKITKIDWKNTVKQLLEYYYRISNEI